MRADNNWEDSVGKRLFELEGELSPQAWENINQRIAPKPRRRWLWLPALLVFISLPLAFYRYYTSPENQLATIKSTQQKPTIPATKTGKYSGNSAIEKANQNQPEFAKTKQTAPGEITQIQTENSAANKAAENTSAGQPRSSKTTSWNTVILPGIFAGAAQEPSKNQTLAEKSKPAKSTEKGIISSAVILKNRKKTPGKMPEKPVAESAGNEVASTPIKSKELAIQEEILLNYSAGNNGLESDKTKQTSTTDPERLAENESVEIRKNGAPISIAETGKDSGYGSEIVALKANATAKDSNAVKELLVALPLTPADTTIATAITKEKSDSAKTKTWAWSVYGAPQYTFQRVQANTTDEIMILRMNNQNGFETERLGYEFGFRGYYPVKEKLQLEIGFHFARVNQHLNFTTASTKADSVVVNNWNGQVSMEIRNREQTEILLFKYFFGGLYAGGKMNVAKNWHLNAGLGTNWLLWKNPDEETIPIATKNFNPYLSAGLRYHYALSPEMTLQAGPTVQYYVRPVQKESAFYQAKPTVIGFSVGLLFHSVK